MSQRSTASPGETLFEQIRHQGFPVDNYRKPHIFDYFRDDSYVGTIFLWRERDKREISMQTLETMRSLEPFFTFLLTDCAARQQRNDPSLRVFQDVIDSVADRIGLTPREKEVFVLLLVSKNRKDISATLHVGIGTINKHITAIFRKAGTSKLNELFGRFFTPLRDD